MKNNAVVSFLMAALIGLTLGGCARGLKPEQQAMVNSCAVSARERAAAFDALRGQLTAVDPAEAELLARYVTAHQEGLNAEASGLHDLAAAAQAGSKFSRQTRRALADAAVTAQSRAENFRKAAPRFRAAGQLANYLAAHQAALDAQTVALEKLTAAIPPEERK